MTPNQFARVPMTPQSQGVRTPHLPAGAGPVGQPVNPVDFFVHMPTGGATVFMRPAEVEQND